ncbi:hypothetical protein [Ectopseudomonas guguanensis]|uniref:hypothetical protein n=1 Tax=Ectopseudomonas guguanensis TaxID=1198456 RepID=UPI0028ADDA66|nr:hypothetical protein [Pseudomonas guguanensis]
MTPQEIEESNAKYDQFLALNQAVTALVCTLAEQGVLDLDRFKHHLDRSAEHLKEHGDETAPTALGQLAEVLLDDARLAVFERTLELARKKQQERHQP